MLTSTKGCQPANKGQSIINRWSLGRAAGIDKTENIGGTGKAAVCDDIGRDNGPDVVQVCAGAGIVEHAAGDATESLAGVDDGLPLYPAS